MQVLLKEYNRLRSAVTNAAALHQLSVELVTLKVKGATAVAEMTEAAKEWDAKEMIAAGSSVAYQRTAPDSHRPHPHQQIAARSQMLATAWPQDSHMPPRTCAASICRCVQNSLRLHRVLALGEGD